MSKRTYHYVCEQDGKEHNFKDVSLTVDGIKYPHCKVCKRCASVFNMSYRVSNAQIAGMDLSQFRIKEASEILQALLHAKNMVKASRSTPARDASFKRMQATLLTDEDKLKTMPSGSPWRMNSGI